MHGNFDEDEKRQWSEIRPEIDLELNRLPEKYRAPIVLCYLEGMSYEEAAQELGLPQTTLKKSITT